MLADLAELYAETVSIEPWTGQDAFGASTYGASVVRAARVAGRSRLVRDAGGNERVSTVTAWLAGAFGVTVKDRVTLPVRFSPQKPPLIVVEQQSDENGAHHETLFF